MKNYSAATPKIFWHIL